MYGPRPSARRLIGKRRIVKDLKQMTLLQIMRKLNYVIVIILIIVIEKEN